MADWINSQNHNLMLHWLKQTKVPMLVSSNTGVIHWCNSAFENYIGYSIAELKGMDEAWKRLTVDQNDALHDGEMANSLVKGDRIEYSYQKSYITKLGEKKLSTIHVLRYPIYGDFEFALVSVIPMGEDQQHLYLELQKLEKMIIALAAKPDVFDKLMGFIVTYPKVSAFAALLLATLLFGERVIQLLQLVMPNIQIGNN